MKKEKRRGQQKRGKELERKTEEHMNRKENKKKDIKIDFPYYTCCSLAMFQERSICTADLFIGSKIKLIFTQWLEIALYIIISHFC